MVAANNPSKYYVFCFHTARGGPVEVLTRFDVPRIEDSARVYAALMDEF